MEGFRFWAQQVFLKVGGWEPPVDVCEDADAYHIIVDVAGVSERDLEVEYQPNGVVVVRGVRRPPLTGAVQCFVLEIPYGTFERRILLPAAAIDPDAIDAAYKAGLLHIRIPKLTPSSSKSNAISVPIRVAP